MSNVDNMTTQDMIAAAEVGATFLRDLGGSMGASYGPLMRALTLRLQATDAACSRATSLLEAQQPLVVAAVKLYDKVQGGESYSVEGKHHVVFDRDSGIDAFWNELQTYRKTLEEPK